MKRVVVTGASGQLGRAIVEAFGAGCGVTALSRRDLDITDHAAVMRLIGGLRPDVVINCAAYNDVDGAEEHAAEALNVNAFAVCSLARAAAEAGATLVHYGTDFVFDGETTRPYREEDPPRPRSFYGSSKLIGEWFARDAPAHVVLRVESLFGGPALTATSRRGSVDTIIDALAAGAEARVFTDRTVSPSYVVDVAAATWTLIERGVAPGLYHCVNTGYCTWRELGEEIARLLQRPPRLAPISVAEFPLRAPRPRFCALSNAKLRAAGLNMPPWQDALARHLASRIPAPS